MEIYSQIESLFLKGLEAVSPAVLMHKCIKIKNGVLIISDANNYTKSFDLSKYKNIFIIGGGKAVTAMANEVENILGNKISNGVIVTKYGLAQKLNQIEVFEAAHPIPDKNGAIVTRKIIEICKKATNDDLILNLLSGGASALLISPIDGISLKDIIQTTELLLKSGATINEMNTIRIHLSKLKGGKLLNLINPAEVVSLIISDVIGDELEFIGSGLTVPIERDYKKCLLIIEKYNLKDYLPDNVTNYFEKELNKSKSGIGFNEVLPDCISNNFIIGNNKIVLTEIEKFAVSMGYITQIMDEGMNGEAKTVGAKIARDAIDFAKSKVKSDKKYCFLYGGETTVTVKGIGKGGRNQELILSAAIELKDSKGITILSGGTDGNDGPTDAAGAICNGETVSKAERLGISAEDYLENNDSYSFFNGINGLIKTGLTGTNVMDIQIVLIDIINY